MAQVGGSRAGRQFLCPDLLQSPGAESPSEASGGRPGPLGPFCVAFGLIKTLTISLSGLPATHGTVRERRGSFCNLQPVRTCATRDRVCVRANIPRRVASRVCAHGHQTPGLLRRGSWVFAAQHSASSGGLRAGRPTRWRIRLASGRWCPWAPSADTAF